MSTEPADVTGENLNAYETASISTTENAASLGPTNQLALTIEFYFQYAVVAIGVFGMAANATVLYALIAYHKRETKKKAVNLLMINQNLLDLLSCILLVITFSLRVGNIYLTGALGYFICFIFLSEHISALMTYASIINLTPQLPKSSFRLCTCATGVRQVSHLDCHR